MEAQALVSLLPQLGDEQAVTQVLDCKYLGLAQERQVVAVPEQVRQMALQVLHILLSLVSPNSLDCAQKLSPVPVLLFPQRGDGHAVRQVLEFKYRPV